MDRGARERRDDRDRVDVRGHRFRASARRRAFEREIARQTAIDHHAIGIERRRDDEVSRDERDFLRALTQRRELQAIFVFEGDPDGVASDGDDACDALVVANGSFARPCKDAEPQFGKDDARVNRFASIRFDRPLDESHRAVVEHALASRDARPTSWTIVGDRTYACVSNPSRCDGGFARELDARIDDPALLVLRVRPLAAPGLHALAHALLGSGRPQAVIDGYVANDELVLELAATATALRLVLALIDETLAATPGRTIVPVLPVDDALLAQYASFRLRESDLTRSRVLDPYVEEYAQTLEARA